MRCFLHGVILTGFPRLHGCWAAEELAYIIKTDSGSEFESLLQEHCFRQPEMAYSIVRKSNKCFVPKILPKIDMLLACLLVCDTQIYEWTDKLTMDQQDAQAKNKKKASSKRSRKSSSVRHTQANRRCCAIILLRWKDNMIIRYSNSRLIYIYILYIYILIHNTKYAPSHCHINIPVQYSIYDTYSLYSNYEYNLMCYLYTCLENPYKCRERAHCMVCCRTASHTKQNN